MTPPLYTILYNEAINRRDYRPVLPDDAIKTLKAVKALPGTYLISRGEGFGELLFTFVYLDRKIYQLIAKLVFTNHNYAWSFNLETYSSIDTLIDRTKLHGYCFLLFAYTPLMKMEGFVPLQLIHEITMKLCINGIEGDYFITEGRIGTYQIARFSRERNAADIYSLKVDENSLAIPDKYKKKFKLNRAVELP